MGTEECDKLDEQMWGSDGEEPVKVMLVLLTDVRGAFKKFVA